MIQTFLTARWEHLILASYPVPPEMLEPRLAKGLALDLRGGNSYVSLVGFMFLDTRVLGIGWPGYRDFPELNLRFYVRRGEERGVMFVREFVPHRLIAWTARALYNEPYRAAPMDGRVDATAGKLTATYGLTWAGRRHQLSAVADPVAHVPPTDSVEQWFKEHQWGYGVSHLGTPLRYEVRHPTWAVHRVRSFTADLDWAAVYGPEWSFLKDREPESVVLAAGSAISVHPPMRPW